MISFLMIIMILVGFYPSGVYASNANFMNAQMINFFRTANDIADVRSLTADEVHVYAVFLSNFYKPGLTSIDMLQAGPDSELTKVIAERFFGGNTDQKTLSTISELNKIVAETIVKGISNQSGTLYSSTNTVKPMTGIELLKKMSGEDINSAIYFGPEKRITLDLKYPAVQGAFKILASYSVDFMLGDYGVAGMTELYVDGFGNIWGAFNEKIQAGDNVIHRTTDINELKLVMPACLNPAAFTSFADADIKGGAKPTQSDLKLPLNNAFAMGAFVDTAGLYREFTTNMVPIYNIYSYFGSKDLQNLLNIFGISSPSKAILQSDIAYTTDLDLDVKLKEFFSSSLNTVNEDSTYIVLTNNMGIVEKRLESLTQDISGVSKKGDLLNYLFGTMFVNMQDVADTLYYFGDSSAGAESWTNAQFKDIGMLGASLFLDTDKTFYSSNAINNRFTVLLASFYNQLGSLDITSTEITQKNIIALKGASNTLGKIFGDESETKVSVKAEKGYGQLVYMVANISEDGSNYSKVLEDSKSFINPTGPITITNVPKQVSALFSLTGAVADELITVNSDYYSDSISLGRPSLFTLKDDTREKELGSLSRVSDASKVKITTKKVLWIIPWENKEFIYTLTSKDSKAQKGLSNNVRYDATTQIGAVSQANNQLFHTFHTYTLFSTHKINLSGTGVGSKITVSVSDSDKEYRIDNFIADAANNWPGVFFGYMVDILQMDKATKVDSGGNVRFGIYSFRSDFLPSVDISVKGGRLDLSLVSGDSGVSNSEEVTMVEMQKNIIKNIYGLLTPGYSDGYRASLLKSTIDEFLISVHRSITGSWLGNMSTVSAGSGSTYQGVVGYIHTPSLEDLPFTAWIMKNYMQVYVLTLLIVSMILILMVLLRMRTWRQGVAIFMFMCFALLLPNILLGNTINISNKITDSIYSDRFDFWALTQHQQALKSLETFERNSKEYTIANNMQKAKEMYSSDAGVRVKWMAPKKSGVFNNLYTNVGMTEGFATNLTIFKWLFSSFIYESDFVGSNTLTTYLYRPYNSIVTAGREYYELGTVSILPKGINDKVNRDITFKGNQGNTQEVNLEVPKVIAEVYEKALTSDRNTNYDKMFYAALVNYDFFSTDNFTSIYYGPNKIEDIKAVSKNRKYIDDSVALWGMGSPEVLDVMFRKSTLSSSSGVVGVSNRVLGPTISNEMSVEDAHLAAFLLNTESPYYYFYNTLLTRYGSNSRFKQGLLDIENYKVRNTTLTSTSVSANGKIRDFLDLEGLFTYMIPYLTITNDYVYDWTSVNGTSVSAFNFDSPDSKIGSDDAHINSSYLKEYQKKQDMESVWNMYSPWVDQLNSLDIYNKKAKIGTKTVRIENTLNPSYYLLAGRPMIFSEADMIAKGYRVSELTDIEIRLQRVLDSTYNDLMYLVNYYDLDDEVLIGAAAMYATFNFNREFSQTKFLGESVMLYPQSFEMKNFNYDAFMRLALLNSTGEPIFAERDLFERVLMKTSVFTGILLIVADVIAVIIIPTLKLILLLMLLFLGILICLTCVVTPPEKIVNTVMKSLALPAMLFMIFSIIFAFLVSLVLGEGLTAYVGSQNISIVTNDPTITILILIIMGLIYIIGLAYIIKMMFDNYKAFGISTALATFGVVAGAVSGIAAKGLGGITNKVKRFGGTLGGAAVGGMLNGKDGAVEGAIHGANGGTVGSLIQSRIREKRGATEYARAMGKDVTANIDSKATKLGSGEVVEPVSKEVPKMEKPIVSKDHTTVGNPKKSNSLEKADYKEGGTKLGNRLEDLAYLKNKPLDKINELKYNTKGAIVGASEGLSNLKQKSEDKYNEIKTTVITGATEGLANLKDTSVAKYNDIKHTVKSRTKGVKELVNGVYLEKSLEQMEYRDKMYQQVRKENDKQRASKFNSTQKAIDKMRVKGGDFNA